MKRKPTAGFFAKKGVKKVLIPGLLMAAALGWTGWNKLGQDIYKNRTLFPKSGVVKMISDGDTFEMNSGVTVRLLGVNAPDRGEAGGEEAKDGLRELVEKKKVYLEYDRYQDDKYGRILAWVWVGCEGEPQFLPAEYMHKSKRESNEGLKENPAGCKKGKLIQEELVKRNGVEIVSYKDRGELKYEERIKFWWRQWRRGMGLVRDFLLAYIHRLESFGE